MPRRVPIGVLKNSIKHFVPRTNISVASGAVGKVVVANTADAPAISAVNDVREGATIKAVHLEFWINGQGATATTQFTIVLVKIPNAGADMTSTNLLNLMSYDNKRNILYTTQGVLGNINNQSVAIIRDWFMLPKGKQRFARGDKLVVFITAVAETIKWCGICIYKEYY